MIFERVSITYLPTSMRTAYIRMTTYIIRHTYALFVCVTNVTQLHVYEECCHACAVSLRIRTKILDWFIQPLLSIFSSFDYSLHSRLILMKYFYYLNNYNEQLTKKYIFQFHTENWREHKNYDREKDRNNNENKHFSTDTKN